MLRHTTRPVGATPAVGGGLAVGATLAAAALLLAFAAPVFAQEPGGEPTIDTGGGTVSTGGEVTVTGEGFTEGDEVTIYFGSASCGVVAVGTATVGPDGTIETTVVVPEEVKGCVVDEGPWEIVAATGDETEGAVEDVNVEFAAGGTLPPTSTLPAPVTPGESPLLPGLILLGSALAALAIGLRSFPARRTR